VKTNVSFRRTRSVIPNLFTLANLFCGFSAIIAYSNRDFAQGTALIFAAGIFDMLDGVMARLTRSASELGVELDSLCDAVSFGVAPSFLLYQTFYQYHPDTGILFASIPAMAGVFRLARFNANISSLEDKEYFRGMPIPAGALTIVSFVTFYVLVPERGVLLPGGIDLWTPAVTLLVAGAMISTIKYDNLPRPSKRSLKQHPVLFVVTMSGMIAGIVTKGVSVFPFMAGYMITGAARYVLELVRGQTPVDDEVESTDDEEEIFYPSEE
jgi:CDP-diacylglycerol--serine O-phosphatidyltransferase